MTATLAVLLPALRPEPDPARDWVREELAKPEYQPTLLERAGDWIRDLISRILDEVGGLGHLDPTLALVLLAGLVVGLVVVLARLRREPSRRSTPGAVLTDVRMTAAQHRALAEKARDAGRWDDVVVESVRAIAVGLVERALVDDLPGATAREVADRGAALFADHADVLHTAADVFDGVRYGDHRAGRESALAVLELEATLRRTRPAEDAPLGPVLAVPR